MICFFLMLNVLRRFYEARFYEAGFTEGKVLQNVNDDAK